MAKKTERCESTWSGPFCASYSTAATAFLPERRFGHGLDDTAQREVVVGHVRLWRRCPGTPAGGVIVRQPEDHEPRHRALLRQPPKLGNEDIGAMLVGNVEVETREVAVGVRHQKRLHAPISGRNPGA